MSHQRQNEIDSGYRQSNRWHERNPVIEYRAFAELDIEAALNDPENLEFTAKYERSIEENREQEKINNFMRGVDEWLKQQH